MREYDKDFKKEAIKLSYEIGPTAAADKLGIPVTTLYTWRKLKGMVVSITELTTIVGQNSAHRQAMSLIEGQDVIMH